jgi:hypothetical protein
VVANGRPKKVKPALMFVGLIRLQPDAALRTSLSLLRSRSNRGVTGSRLTPSYDYLAPSTTYRRDRLVGTRRPLSRQTITLSPYSQRRWAVVREMPNCQQIGFHSVPEARAQTSLPSSGSSQRIQSIASSPSVMARGDGRGRGILGSAAVEGSGWRDANQPRLSRRNSSSGSSHGFGPVGTWMASRLRDEGVSPSSAMNLAISSSCLLAMPSQGEAWT